MPESLDFFQMAGLNLVKRTGWSKGIENFPCSVFAIHLAEGVGRKDKMIDTREACRVSASVGGHGGIEGEDRALSCLSVHMLCSRHLHECVGAFVFVRVLSTSHLASLFCLVAGVRQL